MRDIEKVLKGFLWSQGDLVKGQAKVSWQKFCTPKNQGGLGLKPLYEWNKVLLVRVHIKHNVRNGRDSLVWNDIWLGDEPLSKLISHREVYNARFNYNDTMDRLYDGNKWKWPSEWTQKYPVLLLTDRIFLEERKSDSIWWVDNKKREVKFSINKVLKDLRTNDTKVE
ncbi:hypothetical protein Tco_1140509 [Tanacetum coccineum]